MRIFVRQCLTETRTPEARELIQEVLTELERAAEEYTERTGQAVEFGPGREATRAKYALDFQARFSQETGQAFTPQSFEKWRDAALRRADILVAVRTAMSESTAVEIGRFTTLHPDGWGRCFLLVADTPEATLKTTLLKNAVVIYFSTEKVEDSAYRVADRPALKELIARHIFST